MNLERLRDGRTAALVILGLVVLRLVVAAVTPLTFDEAYYWTWSKHLAGGYYDHPPMVAVVIRLGTLIAGDTELGVRLVSILLVLPMSWAVYRAAQILFGNDRIAAASAVLLNVTLMVAVGTLIVTPDAPLMVASAFVLYSLAKVLDTGRGGLVARGRRFRRAGIAVEIYGAVVRCQYFAVACRRTAVAAVATVAVAISRRHHRLCRIRSGSDLEPATSMGLVHQAVGAGACRKPDAAILR